MRRTEDDDDRGNELAELRERISANHKALAELSVQLIWDQGVRELRAHDGFRRLGEMMADYRRKAVEYIASRRLDEYELGQVQGRLAMLRIVTQAQPLSPEQLDEIRREADNLQVRLTEQLEDERNLTRTR